MRERPKLDVTTPETRPLRVRAPRNSIRVALHPENADTPLVRGWVFEFSVTGMFVHTSHSLPDDTEVHIEWLGRVLESPHRLQLVGWVVYSNETGVAVQFDEKSVLDARALRDLHDHLDRVKTY